jgi:hypothetical protein
METMMDHVVNLMRTEGKAWCVAVCSCGWHGDQVSEVDAVFEGFRHEIDNLT